MLNFRDELNAIKHTKADTQDKYEKAVENILKLILEYYRARTEAELCEAKEIIFGSNSENEVTGKMYDMAEIWDRDLSIVEPCDSKEDAEKVLMLLEEKFKQEEFLTMPASTYEKSRVFSVIIAM